MTKEHQRIWSEVSAPYVLPAPGGIATGVTLSLIMPVVLAHGTEEQKRAWVPKILSGEEIWCQLLSEPGAGSDLAGLLTRATKDGEEWILNGTKLWSSGAMTADYGICLARTNWDVPKHRGLTWFKVPLRHPNVTVRAVREINGSAEFCEEFLDDVVVGSDQVIGEIDGGWPIANFMLTLERGGGGAHDGASAEPTRRKLAPDLVALAEERGTLEDTATRQLIARAQIADFALEALATRMMTAMRLGTLDASAASLIKLGRGLHDPERAQLAMEIGGAGSIAWAPSDVEGSGEAVNFLNGRIWSIAGGSNQIQRNIVSERMLGLPREISVDSDKAFSETLADAKRWGQSRG